MCIYVGLISKVEKEPSVERVSFLIVAIIALLGETSRGIIVPVLWPYVVQVCTLVLFSFCHCLCLGLTLGWLISVSVQLDLFLQRIVIF